MAFRLIFLKKGDPADNLFLIEQKNLKSGISRYRFRTRKRKLTFIGKTVYKLLIKL